MKKNNGQFRQVRLPLVFSFFLLFFLLVIPFSFGHATPVSYTPDSESVLLTVPPQIEILFTERIEPRASSLVVFGPDGNYADKGIAEVDSSNPRLTRVGVEDKGEGSYTLLWKVVSSDDGHFTQGAYVFAVGNQTGGSSGIVADIHYHSSVQEATAQLLELLGFSLIGGILLLIFIARKKDYPLEKQTVMIFFLIACVLILIGNLWYGHIKSHTLAEAYETSILSALPLFLSTIAGKAALARMGIALAMLTLFFGFMWEKSALSETNIGALVLLFLGLITTRIVSSHGAASLIFPTFTFIDHAIHLISKSLWVGGVVMIALLPFLIRKKEDDNGYKEGKRENEKDILISLSKIIALAIGVAGITGAYILWLDLKDFSLLITSAWGRTFISLMVVSTIFLALRLINVFLMEKGGNGREKAFSYSLEAALGIGMLFFTAIIMSTTPPVYSGNIFEKVVEDDDVTIRLTEHLVEQNQFLVEFEGSGADIKGVIVTASESEKGIGPVLIAPVQRFEDGFSFPKSDLSLPGTWDIEITAQRENAYDVHARFSINYPSEVESGQVSHHRSFGSFEWFTVGLGAITALLSIVLYVLMRKRGVAVSENASPSKRVAVLGMGLLIGVLLCTGVFFTGEFVKSDFEKECESTGGMWHEWMPMKDGKSVGMLPREGCMSADGSDHFADEREYLWSLAESGLA